MNVFVGNKLKKLRKNKNFSQEEMADYLNISQSAYARMESGESHSWASHINDICRVFEISPEELVKSESVVINNNQQGGSSNNAIVIDQLSEKLIEQYEERIKELKEVIENLKANKKG
jgi:transcriptional regulator with XRE-family HTH domain